MAKIIESETTVKCVKGVTTVTVTDSETGEVFTGVATKSPNDKFNAEIGYRIAKSRACIKRAETEMKFLADKGMEIVAQMMLLDKALGEINKGLEKCSNEITGYEEYIESFVE